jgi:ATP synthase subunit 6
MFLYSSLEQFEVFPLLTLQLGALDLSFTNASLSVFLAFFFFFSFYFSSSFFYSFNFKPSRFFSILKIFIYMPVRVVLENVGTSGKFFFEYISFLFISLIIINVFGMIPYNFTATSHLITTFSLAFVTFLIINIIGVTKHKSAIFGLFLPSGAPFMLIPLLIPIEFISYVFRVISLSVRLFANMMAGHTLLKVIAGFAWTMFNKGGIFTFLHLIPLFIVFLLIGLELGVALIQAYVFTILSCIYLSDVISLH